MNAFESVEDFLGTLQVKEKTKRFKKRVLTDLLQYIKDTEDILTEDWSLDETEKVMIGDILVCRCPITTAPFANFLSKVYKEGKKGRSYNEYVYTLHQFGEYLADNGILLENPARDLEPAMITKHDRSMERLTLDEAIDLLIAAWEYDDNRVRNFTLVLMLLSTAARIGELKYLQEDKLFIKNGILYCYGKSNERIRFLTPGLKISLEKLLKEPSRLKALEGFDERYIFYSSDGGPLTTDEANAILKELASRAGISRDISTYWLRRTFATILAQVGVSTRTIQIIFDHDKIQTTEGYISEYLRIDIRNLLDNSVIHRSLINNVRKNITLLN